jgi:hypothetical protein
VDLSIYQRVDVLVVDVLLAVGRRLEAHEGVFEPVAGDFVAEILELVDEGVAAGVLAHDQGGLLHADAFRRHDLVGLGVLEHAVLMDAGLVGEGVAADDRLVVLHRERGRGRHQLGGARQHGGVDAGPERQHVIAHLHRHDDLSDRRNFSLPNCRKKDLEQATTGRDPCLRCGAEEFQMEACASDGTEML